MVQTKNIVVVGAGGNMVSVTLKELAAKDKDVSFVLTDRDERRLKAIIEGLGHPENVRSEVVDLFDPERLDSVVSGADLVVNGAGPYYRTAAPVMEACLRTRTNYLDLDDDVESTMEAVSFADRAREAGVSLLIGCGVSPGVSNVVGRDLLGELDTVESLDIAGVLGGDVDDDVGPAVIQHLVHIITTHFDAWHDGTRKNIPSWTQSAVFGFSPPLGDVRVYEVAHPESATFPLTYPDVPTVRLYIGMYPQAYNGLMQGVGVAYRKGRMTMDDIIAFFGEVFAGKAGTLKGWRASLRGMAAQVLRRENTARDALKTLVNGVRGRSDEYIGEFLWTAIGTRGGRRVRLVRRLPMRAGTVLEGAANVTGRGAAAFVRLALDDPPSTAGVFAPEAWTDPSRFYQALVKYGYPAGVLDRTEEYPA